MNWKRAVPIAIISIFVALWWLFLTTKSEPAVAADVPPPSISSISPKISAPPGKIQPIKERRKALVDKILGILATPITFYGKAIDQNGDPVPGANIDYGAIDEFDAPGSDYKGKADTNGNFSINGIKGAVLTVGVWKTGYYNIHNISNASFAYGIRPDSTRKSPPTKENPAIFILHKAGKTEPLIRIAPGAIKISKNGTPIDLDLITGHRTSSKNSIRVEAWTNNAAIPPNSQQHYDWRCRITVPEGGLIERTEHYNFEAPESGYHPFDEYSFMKDDKPWAKRLEKDYFIKFSDGKFARLQFSFTSGGDHYFRIESFLNPNTDSRNLEFNPAKVIQSP